jgi:hypothetical protein
MPEIGDVVEIRAFPAGERWVVMRPVDNAVLPGRMWHLRRERNNGPPLGHVAGDGDIEFVSHPVFQVGQVVNYSSSHDGRATVLADNGDTTVRISFKARRPRGLDRETPLGVDGASFMTMEVDADRGALVAANLL